MSAERKKILVVEENPGMLSQLRKRLYGEGYEPFGAADTEAAVKAIREHAIDLMVLNLDLIDEAPVNSALEGFGLLGLVRRCLPEVTIPVLLFTVDDSDRLDDFGGRQGVYAVHRKAGGFNQLLEGIASTFAGGTGGGGGVEHDPDGHGHDEAAA